MKRKKLYPGVLEAEKQKRLSSLQEESHESDIILTSGGYCPNYDKFYRLGYKEANTILCMCNLD